MQATDSATLWHRRVGHLNRKGLHNLKNIDGIEVEFVDAALHYDACALGKSRQLAHPKTADHKVERVFQLVMTYMRGSFMPEVPGGFRYVYKIPNEHA